ncbi:small ribosomal subunit Rsm22 family protein [Catenulispora pinisilvae]|uniref:small ribosomal subunit Rsm22 family protein n=1 Tax=Catenulispora pinisilvae TaxID=2705253 RepID=UPI0018923EC7|nr:small ribosomal subunit Rsm22 family protein [Catenulispora pinisilvae]
MDLPADLAASLEAATADLSLRELEASVDRLIARYRTPGRADRPILSGAVDAAAYAAYRMPATWSAVRAALSATAARLPGLAPQTLVDVGGGTGAAAWAAAGVFGDTLNDITVLDQVPEALDLGRRLARDAFSGALRHTDWRQVRFPAEIPAADLVTVSYVLSELAPEAQEALVRASAAAGETIAVIEPGTPDGYQRIMAARDVLTDMGLHIAAPCPHSQTCPLLGTRDWCHFASRIHRTPLHRRLKGADLGHEDEKFAYVVATREPLAPAAPARILRHPQIRKGLVMMQLCQPDSTIAQALVSKRQGDTYRAARDADWGGTWTPPVSLSESVSPARTAPESGRP